FYEPCAPVIKDLLLKSKSNSAVELCAGGGGGIMKMLDYLKAIGCSPNITLTDLYPNTSTWGKLKSSSEQIDFSNESVNALQVPTSIQGLRLMFSAVHHFKPEQVKAMIQDAIEKKASFAFFDSGTTNLLTIPGILLMEPITFILLTPFFKPFRWSRLFFTYIIPLIILCTMWDGSISVLRFYSLKELKAIVEELKTEDYILKAGEVKNKLGIKVNYISGYPITR
ncbi:MAG: hypothetical protein ACHQD9_06230, partial [Chitinophagales bacterium]